MKKFLILIIFLSGIVNTATSQDKTWQPLEKQTYGTEYKKVPPFLNQADNPYVFPNINISQNTAPQNEPSIFASRKNPNRIVAAWRDFRLGVDPNANRRVGYSYSTDGGLTWSIPQLLDSMLLPNLTRNSDPVVTCDTAGNFYIAVVAISLSAASVDIGVYKSTDGGVTFPAAYLAASGFNEDKEWIATDLNAGSIFANSIYISWTRFAGNTGIKLTKSTNGGVNWTNPPANVSDVTSSVQGSYLCVSPDGQVNVVWLQFSGNNAIVKYDMSGNGGLSFGTDVNISTGPRPQGLPNNAYSFPVIAVDCSGGPRNGWLYTVFCDNRNGDADVFFTRSSNSGVTWSASLRLNNDLLGNGKIQYWPWIAVNETGKIAVIWYDTRNTSNNTIIELFLARSYDGGNTFTNELISSQPSPTNIPGTNVRFGDYICLDFIGNRIIPVWTDERAGGFDMEIYTADITDFVGILPISNEIPSDYSLKQNYPNPFNPVTNIEFSVPENSNISIKVFDISGREVFGIFTDKFLKPGIYKVQFDGSKFSSGVYYYSLSVNGIIKDSRKMILLK